MTTDPLSRPPTTAEVPFPSPPSHTRHEEQLRDMATTGSLSSARRAVTLSVLFGLFGALLVGGAGAAYVATRHAVWTAEASVVVLPADGFDASTEASLYETLSRGQVVETLAELARNDELVDRSAAGLDVDAADLSIDSNPVPATSVVLVRGSASTPSAAEALAQTAADGAATYFEALDLPYRVESVRDASGTAERTDVARALLGLVVAVASVLTFVTLQQALVLLLRTRQRSGVTTNSASVAAPA